jgi:vacuolar-type H+-ATPase subunit I/STV1
MKHKIFQLLVISTFFIVFGYFYGEEFWQYQESQQQETAYQEGLSQGTNDFSIEHIVSFEDTELLITPDL